MNEIRGTSGDNERVSEREIKIFAAFSKLSVNGTT
jgi:hypothetical protein